MVKKCLYCGENIEDNSVIDFCEPCGIQAFGRKMFDTLKQNMEDARENGDLCNTRVDQFTE